MIDNEGGYIVNGRYHITIKSPFSSDVVFKKETGTPHHTKVTSDNKREDSKNQPDSDTSEKRCCSENKKNVNKSESKEYINPFADIGINRMNTTYANGSNTGDGNTGDGNTNDPSGTMGQPCPDDTLSGS